MNFLGAVLLLVVDEESAFWGLAALVERIMPGHFDKKMTMALVDQGVVSAMLLAEDTELVEHLVALQVAPSLVTTQWLLTCFVGSAIPLSALLRLWDCLFETKSVAVFFGVAAALLASSRAALMATEDTAVAYRALSSLGADLTDEATDALLAATFARQRRAVLEPECLHAMRAASAARFTAEQRFDSAEEVAAAVTIAEATAAELRESIAAEGAAADRPPMPAPAGSAAAASAASVGGRAAAGATVMTEPAQEDWAIVPMPDGGDDGGGGGWSLIDRVDRGLPAAEGGGTSLSFWILQIEAPRLLESHFESPSPAGAARGPADTALVVAARLDELAPGAGK